MPCSSWHHLAIFLLLADIVFSTTPRELGVNEAGPLTKRDRPICNPSFGRPRKSDCDAAIRLIADTDELFTIVSGQADASLNQRRAPWFAEQIGNCLVVASLMHQAIPDSISLSAIKAQAEAISAECVGQLGVGGASIDLGVHDRIYVAIFWKNPNVNSLPNGGQLWTRLLLGCLRGVVQGVETNPYFTGDVDSCLNDANGGPDTDCGPVAGYCKADSDCCSGLACAAKAMVDWLLLFGTDVIKGGEVGSCILSPDAAMLKPRAVVEKVVNEESGAGTRSTARSSPESLSANLGGPTTSLLLDEAQIPKARAYHSLLATRSKLVKRAFCNALYGAPTPAHCARAFRDVPNPLPNNIQIQFVASQVDAPLSSPIFQLPKFYAYGDCRIAVMNYDPGLGPRWDIEDFATWADIRSSMGHVMNECANEPRRRGGTEKTGTSDEIAIYVYKRGSEFYTRISELTLADAISDSELELLGLGHINRVVPAGLANPRPAVPPSPFSAWVFLPRGHSCYTSYCAEDGDCCQAFQCIKKTLTLVNSLVMFGARAISGSGGSICSFSGE